MTNIRATCAGGGRSGHRQNVQDHSARRNDGPVGRTNRRNKALRRQLIGTQQEWSRGAFSQGSAVGTLGINKAAVGPIEPLQENAATQQPFQRLWIAGGRTQVHNYIKE